ncbi:efflux RND transporter periplasmic adaptor subunit [Heliobacterium gestii]|uniref:Efflux RND transporter periplasmic adaptor subunit n=1 Tax=Heliomicrobium gestii TaxID=2699 RepID=A0A845LBJ5_HELGE|nr:efflux RND transporter periplasmic adaptor subunit [Heliomicrobium gestii]MBM7865635.1 HlyD family secretion protein [Heliomicrobium gestii]MZP41885.1 efflux RND transporter periplasmic adaptor subunit [Heliomicrobium gestii]
MTTKEESAGSASRGLTALLKKKTMVAIVALCLLGAGGGYSYWHQQQASQSAAVTYRDQVVKRATVTQKISALGQLKPIRTQEIKAKADGTILKLFVHETDRVQANQPILMMDNSSSQAQVAARESSLAQARYDLKKALDGAEPEELAKAEATVKQQEIAVQRALTSLQRTQALYDSGAETKDNLEKAQVEVQTNEQKLISNRADLDTLRKGTKPEQIEVLKAKVKEAEENLKAAMQDYSGTEITVPFAGVVLSIPVEEGEFAAQEMVMATVADLSVIQGSFYVKEIDIAKVKLGMDALVTVDALGGKGFKGKVTRVGQNPKTIDNIVNYEVLVDIDNAEGELRSGMTMTAEIVINEKANALTVPTDALVTRDSAQGVLMAGDSPGAGEPRFTPVKTGLRSDALVEVLEGLSEGDHVLIENRKASQSSSSSSSKSTKNSDSMQPPPMMGGPGMGPP